MNLQILDTDRFFRDSPDAGDPGCRCSRCHRQILDGEVPLRVAIDEKDFFFRDLGGSEHSLKDDVHLGGYEFRLCEPCTDKLLK